MSDNKKYYYLKLKDNYFEQDSVKILESLPNGPLYSLIILKLYLKACKYDGQLRMTETIPYDPSKINVLAKVIDHDPDNTREAIRKGIELGIITLLDSGELWMTEIQSFIGHSSTEADRIRLYRKKINPNQIPYKCTPEIEIEKDIEKEKELEKEKDLINGFSAENHISKNSFDKDIEEERINNNDINLKSGSGGGVDELGWYGPKNELPPREANLGMIDRILAELDDKSFPHSNLTVAEVRALLEYFLNKFLSARGDEHPVLKYEHWQRVIKDLFVEPVDVVLSSEALAVELPEYIDRYFDTDFKFPVDYSILHFSTDGIIENRFYETYYRGEA